MASSDDQIQLTHTKKLGNSEFDIFCKSQPGISHYIFSIEKYLKNAHPFYYNSLLAYNKGRPLETIEKNFKVEYEKLLEERSTFQIIEKALTSRDKCIQKIRQQLPNVQRVLTMFRKSYLHPTNTTHNIYQQYVQRQGYSNISIQDSIQSSIKTISLMLIDMSRLRDMTIYVVETIHKWKVEVEEWMDKCGQHGEVGFVHDGKDAYFIILEDLKFFWTSSIAEYIYIDTENDPFIVRNVMQVEERSHKNILEKYFVEFLYPKSEEIVTKAMKCYEMLVFKYEPQKNNLYREEQLLIENYLSLKKKQQEEEGVDHLRQQQFEWEKKVKNDRQNKLTPNGWVFGKVLKQPNNEKVKQMMQRHQQKITFIRPFNITNYTEKNSLALAYQAQHKNPDTLIPLKSSNIFQNKKQKDIQKLYRSRSTKNVKQRVSLKKISLQHTDKGYKSENQSINKNNSQLSRMYQSLSKLSPVILEDPREQNDEETPKNKSKLTKDLIEAKMITSNSESNKNSRELINSSKLLKTMDKINHKNHTNGFETVRNKRFLTNSPTLLTKNNNSKLNTFDTNMDSVNKSIDQISEFVKNEPEINNQNSQVQPIAQISSQDNTIELENKVGVQKKTTEERKKKLETNQSKLLTIRQLIDTHTKAHQILPKQRSLTHKTQKKSPYLSSKQKQSRGKKLQNKKLSNQKSQSHSATIPQQQNEFTEYKQVPLKQNTQLTTNQPFKFVDDFIILTSKSVPIDLVPQYLKYLFSQLHSTSKKFSLYSYDSLLKKLQDPCSQCIIFEISTQKRGPMGQVILSQSMGVNNRKLKYTIEFINIHVFELVVGAVLRVAEELLYATPCEQVVCPLMEDKLDPVSGHFVQLIEDGFKTKVKMFGELTILEKKKVEIDQVQLHQKLCIFSSPGNRKLQQIDRNRIMMGNYRSLRIQCKCIMLSSNFRMRSKNISKSNVASYMSQSLGLLYRKVLQQIITKFHLKQMKLASVQANQLSEAALLLKQSPFLRSSITALAQYLRQPVIDQDDYIYMNRFTSMGQVLKYMQYKEYQRYFNFDFLQESRFILHHEMYLTEIQLDLSLEFMVRQSVDFLILFNYHNFMIKVIEPNSMSSAKAVILPTTNEQIELIIMDGRQYEFQTTNSLDLFSYLYIYQQNNLKNYKQQHNLKEIVIPMIHNSNRSINSIKQFDGLFRLFPQREFYSGTYFNCSNLWESYFPSAVVYQPAEDSIVFQYPLIVGFLHKAKKEILTAFVLKNQGRN